MRRKTGSEKVIRAISIGIATMLAVTSTPATVFADDTNVQGGGDGARRG